jgi:calcineurin-binding protein cabin-1
MWTFSSDRENDYKEFQRCFSILNGNHHVNNNGGSVMIPYCRVDKEISLERVRHELRLLEVETLLKSSSAKMLDSGKYSELIKLLSPVILSNNEKCFVQTWGANKVCAVDSSIELTALDMLISACEKASPKDLAVLLKCHKQRLEFFCLAAGVVELPAPAHVMEKASTLNDNNLTFELEQEEARKGHWNKMVADEVKSISRCASQIREEIEESETPVGVSSSRFLNNIYRFLGSFKHAI